MEEHRKELKSIEETLAEHLREKQDHIETLTSADAAFTAAQKQIEEGRRRLQNALDRYKERMNGNS